MIYFVSYISQNISTKSICTQSTPTTFKNLKYAKSYLTNLTTMEKWDCMELEPSSIWMPKRRRWTSEKTNSGHLRKR